ncbi:MAG: hypothetical protein WBC04_08345 [Candidatus Acidiferrales bacterium]
MADKDLLRLMYVDKDLLRLMYEKSQDSAEHNDLLVWEVTAIIWSASALLIGFIVEVLGTEATAGQLLIVCSTSILAIFLTWVAHEIMKIANTMMNRKYNIC